MFVTPTLGSLFDGIGGFPLAGIQEGITPVWASEIERFSVEVTKKNFPETKQLGDIAQIKGAEIEPMDIISAGSPCQDLSVAGKRGGIGGQRSGLFMEFVRVVREMRNATDKKFPRFAVWENVPGAFSSNRGQDFRTVLEEISESAIPIPESGKWANAGMVRGNGRSIAWRVLDAQYWGVPQRRKRIFLVADFTGGSAGEILFEQQSMSRNFEESGKTWEKVTVDIGGNTENSSRNSLNRPTLTTDHHFVFSQQRSDEYIHNTVVSTQTARQHKASTDLVLVRIGHVVRRLTVTECLRLQGFPDQWLDKVPGYSDSAGYRAIGNSVVIPCVRHVMRGIKTVLRANLPVTPERL